MNGGFLRPLGIGEMLDAAIKIYLGRWKPLVAVVFVITAPVLLLQSLVQLSAGSSSTLTTSDPQTGLPEFDASAFWVFVAASLVALVLTTLAGVLATAGTLRIVSGAYLGDQPDWRQSLRYAWSRFGRVVWVSVLATGAMLLGALACLVGAVWAYTVFSVAVPVVLVDDVRGAGALRRSYRLVEGRFWPVLGVLILGGLLGSVVQGIISSPALVLTFVAPSAVVTVIAQFIGNLVAVALVTPYTSALVMVLYFDLRVRKEGFDLTLLATRVGVEPPDQYPLQPGVRPVAPGWAPPPGGAWPVGQPPPLGWPPPPETGPGGGWGTAPAGHPVPPAAVGQPAWPPPDGRPPWERPGPGAAPTPPGEPGPGDPERPQDGGAGPPW